MKREENNINEIVDLCLKDMPKLTVVSSTPKKQVHVENDSAYGHR